MYTMLPDGFKQNEVEVEIGPKHLKIALHGKKPIINDELFSHVHDASSAHNISRQGELSIFMQKAVADVEWPCVLQAHNWHNNNDIEIDD